MYKTYKEKLKEIINDYEEIVFNNLNNKTLNENIKLKEIKDYKFNEGDFIVYLNLTNSSVNSFFISLNYFKELLKNINKNYYLIVSDRYYYIHWIFSFNKYHLDKENIYILKNGSYDEHSERNEYFYSLIKPDIFQNYSNFVAIIDDNHSFCEAKAWERAIAKRSIVEDYFKNFILKNVTINVNKEQVDKNAFVYTTKHILDVAKIDLDTNFGYAFLLLGIYDKYGGVTEQFLKDLKDLETKIEKIYKKHNLKYEKYFKDTAYNNFHFKNILTYILLSNDYRVIADDTRIYKDRYNLEKRSLGEEILHSIKLSQIFGITYFTTKDENLEKMIVKHIIYKIFHKKVSINYPSGLQYKLVPEIYQLYKNFAGEENLTDPKTFSSFRRILNETIKLYFLYNNNKKNYIANEEHQRIFLKILKDKLREQQINTLEKKKNALGLGL